MQAVLSFVPPCISRLKGTNSLTSLCSKNLTWRDMQHLVVRTSNPAHLSTNDWKINGVGRRGKSPSRCFSLLPPFSFPCGFSFHFPAAWTFCDVINNIIIGCTNRQTALELLMISASFIHLFTYNVSLLNCLYSYFQQYWFFSLSYSKPFLWIRSAGRWGYSISGKELDKCWTSAEVCPFPGVWAHVG